MVKPKHFSNIKESSVKDTQSVKRVVNVVERHGSKAKRFVLKYIWFWSHSILGHSTKAREELSQLKIPVSSKIEVFGSENKKLIKQKDYSWTGKIKIKNAHQISKVTPELQRVFIGIVRDIALMHKEGIHLDSREKLFAPWIVYKKPNGNMDRVVVDYGSIKFKNKNQGVPSRNIKNNFERLESFLRYQDDNFKKRALQMYFNNFPDSPNKRKYLKMGLIK